MHGRKGVLEGCTRQPSRLRDIDCDFDANRRDEVKEYLERRYNKNGKDRVFSAGTFTTIKMKTAIKDVCRTYKIPQNTTNYITKIIDDQEISWTDFMRIACKDKRIADFVKKYPDAFDEMLPIIGQARAEGVHPSATIIVPEVINEERVDCFDVLPIRKMNNMLVSEISGADIDTIGILKNDVLGIKELTRLSYMLDLIEIEYGTKYTILEIASKHLDDPKVFEVIKQGNTQGIFQMSGEGITKFIKRMAPDNINDIIASVALFRPGPLDSGSADNYVRAKKGEFEPEYLWGTYEILNDTYGEMIYQEQISRVAQKIGSLSLGDGVNLVKALSKKKLDKVRKFKDKFFDGANRNGCPIDASEKIWSNVEAAARYSFNKSHSVAYGLTAYIGAWLKANYPTAFYTVVLRDQDDDKMAVLMNEIERVGGTKLEHPDINISGENFTADFKSNVIYWSLARIKYVGPKAVQYIVQERNLYGEFYDMEDFIKRIFKSKFKSFDDEGTEETRERCPVTARNVRNLIFAGAFDKCEHVNALTDRYALLEKAAGLLGFKLSEKEVPEELRGRHYFWSMKQIEVSGHGAIDYKRILEDSDEKKITKGQKYIEFKDLHSNFYNTKKGVFCATITSVISKSYRDKRTGENKHFGKIELQQNTETNVLTIWDDWDVLKKDLMKAEGKIIMAVAGVRWSDYDEKNTLQIGKSSFLKLV